MTGIGYIIRLLTPADRQWVARRIAESWGAEIVVAHGQIFRPAELPGFAAEAEGQVVGLLTYHRVGLRHRRRGLPPEIPLYDEDDLPIRDEIELEMILE
ncbi:MAG: hypothetical protein Q7U34_07025 [Anaerolineales bacterium]|nr:hypothetical protein [Anaerolineales bacterium]MDO9348378.1 hypothetical protein [Anaerolineales bacterium]MDP3185495.1 hypothetical protein [Anaerolineales bacterium]